MGGGILRIFHIHTRDCGGPSSCAMTPESLEPCECPPPTAMWVSGTRRN